MGEVDVDDAVVFGVGVGLEFGPDIAAALRYFTGVTKKRCTAFLISDFYADGYDDAIKIASRKHDLVAIRVSDRREKALTDIGLAKFYDPESTETLWVDTGSASVRRVVDARAAMQAEQTERTMLRYGIDMATLHTGEDFVKPLRTLLKRRS